MEHKTETGNEDGMDWEKETFTSPDGRITYIVTSGTFPNIGRKPKTNDNVDITDMKAEIHAPILESPLNCANAAAPPIAATNFAHLSQPSKKRSRLA